MKFPNAQAGVKKIFTAEILALITSICLTAALAFGYLATKTVTADGEVIAEGGLVAAAGGLLIFGIAGAVLAIISFIIKIIGVNSASKDESYFKTALYLIIAGLVVSAIGSFLSDTSIKTVFSSIGDVINLAVTCFIIQGIRNLADKLNNGDMNAKGATIFKIIIVVNAIIIIASIIAIFSKTIAGILTVVSAVLNIVQYIIFLTYLSKAKKMLA